MPTDSENMSNSLDDKIKQALEEFEMPYDATAWTEFEKQLPARAAPTSGNSALKLAAGLVVVSTIVTTIWFLNRPDENRDAEPLHIEQLRTTGSVETNTDQQIAESEEVVPTDVKERVAEVDASDSRPTAEVRERVDNAPEPESQPENGSKNNTILFSETPSSNTSEPEKNNRTEIKDESRFVVDFLPSTLNVCAGSDVSFINNSSDLNAQLVWDFGDGTTSAERDPVHSFILPGTYTVTLRGMKKNQSDEHSAFIMVHPSPTPMFSSGRKLDGYVAIPLYNFSTGTQPGEAAVWTFSDGVVRHGNNATHLFRESGKHNVKLTVSNQYGCSTSVDETISTFEHFNLLAPTAFTPDGDGNNETFIPVALRDMGVPFELVIRSQTGQVVFQTTDPNEAWDGTLQNSGQKADAGTYVWTVLLKENIVNRKDFNGTIHLTR